MHVSGMMLWIDPPSICPTVSTADWVGSITREIAVCSCMITDAAATIGSSAWCGRAACPDRPRSTTSNSSADAVAAPYT